MISLLTLRLDFRGEAALRVLRGDGRQVRLLGRRALLLRRAEHDAVRGVAHAVHVLSLNVDLNGKVIW